MTTKNIVIITAIVVLLVVGGYFLFSKIQWPQKEQNLGEEETVLPPATGKVDDLMAAMSQELLDEDSVLQEEAGDTQFITNDTREISNFGQSINEDEL